MTNPTSNYGFVLPNSADLVTDLPADFDVALQGVDTRLKALQPGTTLGDIAYSSATANTNTRLGIGTAGQVLSVVAGVPAWTTGTTGDIEGVTAGTGISGGGTSGTVTVTNSMATAMTTKGDLVVATGSGAFVRQAVGTNNQVLMADSVEADGVKYANEATATLTTTGDILYASAANTLARRAIGTTGQLLAVSAGVPTWTTVSAGAMTSLASGSLSGSSVSITSISGDYRTLYLVVAGFRPSTDNASLNGRINSDTSAIYTNRSAGSASDYASSNTSWNNLSSNSDNGTDASFNLTVMEFLEYASTSIYKYATKTSWTRADTATGWNFMDGFAQANTSSAITSIQLFPSSGNFTSGSYVLYGVK